MPPGYRRPARELDFCKWWGLDLKDLAVFELEDGFLESAAAYMGFWYGQRHRVLNAVMERALDPKQADQMKWVDKFMSMTTPGKVRHVSDRKRGASAEPQDDDDIEVDLST